jgi:hypothetical protein
LGTLEPPTNVGWSAPQIMNLDFSEPGIGGRPLTLHMSHTAGGNYSVSTNVGLQVSMHQFDRLLPQTVVDRYGHFEVRHDRQLYGRLI